MRYFILIMFFLLLLIPVLALGNPFLVCDPQDNVEYYQISGSITANDIAAQPNGSLRYDLQDVAAATHKIQVKACNHLWGCSEQTEFSFKKKIPAAPSTIWISPR